MNNLLPLRALLIASIVACTSLAKATEPTKSITLSTVEDAVLQQISIEVLKQAYREIGYKVIIVRYPNERSLLTADAGQVDGEVSRIWDIRETYKNLIPIPSPVNQVNVVAFSKGKPVLNIGQLSQSKLSCARGVKIVESLAKDNNLNCYFSSGFAQALRMLDRDRVDFALLPQVNGYAMIKDQQLINIQQASQALASEPLFHYLHKKRADLVAPLDQAIQTMQHSGRIEAIRKNILLSISMHNRPEPSTTEQNN